MNSVHKKGKILAIDYGLKRCGFAVSDESREIALPRSVVATENVFKELEELLNEGVAEIVIGLPLSLKGHDSSQTEHSRLFAQQVQERFPAIAITLRDERFSTAAVSRRDQGKNVKLLKVSKHFHHEHDKYSAAYILQGYLDQLAKNRYL